MAGEKLPPTLSFKDRTAIRLGTAVGQLYGAKPEITQPPQSPTSSPISTLLQEAVVTTASGMLTISIWPFGRGKKDTKRSFRKEQEARGEIWPNDNYMVTTSGEIVSNDDETRKEQERADATMALVPERTEVGKAKMMELKDKGKKVTMRTVEEWVNKNCINNEDANRRIGKDIWESVKDYKGSGSAAKF